MTDKEFDKLIERSVKEFGSSYGNIENTEPQHIFSERFENNMKMLIGRQKKKKIHQIIRIFAGAAAVLVIGVGAVTITRMFSDGSLFSMNGSTAATPDIAGKEESTANFFIAEDKDTDTDIAQNDTEKDDNAYSFKNDTKQDDSPDEEDENADIADAEEDFSQPSLSENQTGEPTNKSTTAYAYRVTAQSHGIALKLTDEQIDTLTEMAKEMVNDARLTVDLAMSYEEMDSFKADGYYITVSMQDGSPIEIDHAGGETLRFHTITLMLKDDQGYALADNENGSAVFEISGADEIYGILEKLLNV